LLVKTFAFLFLGSMLLAQRSTSTRQRWNKPYPPFPVIGNIYYVGATGVSSFLITTPAD
jgi:metallo-beta-lactamase class B